MSKGRDICSVSVESSVECKRDPNAAVWLGILVTVVTCPGWHWWNVPCVPRKTRITGTGKNRLKKTQNKTMPLKKVRFETKSYPPNTVLGQVQLFSRARVIFFNREVAVSVVSGVKHGHHPGWNPQHSHHWNNMRNGNSFELCTSLCNLVCKKTKPKKASHFLHVIFDYLLCWPCDPGLLLCPEMQQCTEAVIILIPHHTCE